MGSAPECGARLRFMDCNCRIGTFEAREEAHFTDICSLLTEMEYLGIAEALVMHSWASRWSPRDGNCKLDEMIAGRENLRPCYVGLPAATDELDPPAEFAAQVRSRNGAVRLFPRDHQWEFTPWCAGSLLQALAAEHVPVLIDIGQTSWDQVATVLERYPQLPLLLLNTSYRIDRRIYPLFEAHEKLYLVTHSYQMTWGIEDISCRFGAERLIFGTGLPESDGGGPLAQVLYADLSDDEKALIAGGNLRRLLGL